MTMIVEPVSNLSMQNPQAANDLVHWQKQRVDRTISFPAFMYTSEAIDQLERKQFFPRNWIYVGHWSQ